MKIILTSETSIRLVPDTGPMTIEAASVEQQYSPFHMLGSSLAFCTFSVMYSWANHVKLPVDDLVLDVAWEFADDPHRVGRIDMTFDWPSLPEKRLNAAKRAAALCTIHATLHHPPVVNVRAAGEASGRPATVEPSTSDHANTMTRDEQRDQQHEHGHTHADGTTHRHPHAHEGEHAHAHGNDALRAGEVEVRRGTDEGGSAADLPPSPSQQGDGQEAATARPTAQPSREAR